MRARASGSRASRSWPLKSTSPPSIVYPGWPASAYESVDLPDPFGPITACTSPLLMARVTPLRISLPSTLARRSRISKSANLVLPLLDFIGAVRGRLAQPRGSLDRSAQKALVHVPLVLARQGRAAGHVLDGAVAVADGQPALGQRDHLGHVPVLGRQLSQFAHPGLEVEARQARRVLGLEARRTALEELLQLRLVEELDQVAGELAVRVGEVIRGRGGQGVDVLGAP